MLTPERKTEIDNLSEKWAELEIKKMEKEEYPSTASLSSFRDMALNSGISQTEFEEWSIIFEQESRENVRFKEHLSDL